MVITGELLIVNAARFNHAKKHFFNILLSKLKSNFYLLDKPQLLWKVLLKFKITLQNKWLYLKINYQKIENSKNDIKPKTSNAIDWTLGKIKLKTF